jgi:hypothetical protein
MSSNDSDIEDLLGFHIEQMVAILTGKELEERKRKK